MTYQLISHQGSDFYAVKLSLLLDNLLKDISIFKTMSIEEIDRTVFSLIQQAELQPQVLVIRNPSHFGDTHRGEEEKTIYIIDKILKNNLSKSLEYYFAHAGYPNQIPARKMIMDTLNKILNSRNLNSYDLMTLKVILKNIPTTNINNNLLCLPSRILTLSIDCGDIIQLFKICTENNTFDFFSQNDDGSYFFECFIHDISSKDKEHIDPEKLIILSFLLEHSVIHDHILNYIYQLADSEKQLFNSILLNDKLKTQLPLDNEDISQIKL